MALSQQLRLPLAVFAGRELGVTVEESAEISRVLEAQLVADFICRAAGEQQQALGFLHHAFKHQALGRQVGDAPAHIVQPRLGHADLLRIARQGPVLKVMRFDQRVEAVENFQVFVPGRGGLARVGAQPQQADHDQPGQRLQRRIAPRMGRGNFVAERFQPAFEPARLGLVRSRHLGQGNAGRPHLHPGRQQAGVGFDQLPDQLLTHRQHMAVAVWLGDEGMRHRRRRQEEHRPGLDVLLIIQVHPHRTGLHVMHLKKPVVPVNGHVAPEKPGKVAQPVVVHLAVAVALVVDLADVDVRNGMPITHDCLPAKRLPVLTITHGAPAAWQMPLGEALTFVNILTITLTH